MKPSTAAHPPRRRLLLPPNPPTSPPPGPSRSETDPAEPARSDPSSVAMAALLILLALFFLAFFSLSARRFFSRSRHPHSHPRPPPPSPPPPGPRRYAFGPACGVDPLTLGSLPVLALSVGGGAKEDEEGEGGFCVVCLSELEGEERVKVIPGCGHVFHPRCIDAWLASRGSCPLCRCSDMAPGFSGAVLGWGGES